MTVILVQKDVEIVFLKVTSVKGHEEGPGQNGGLCAKTNYCVIRSSNRKPYLRI